MAAVTVLADLTGRVPHYSGGAEVTGSVIFIVLVGAVAAAVLRRRRR